MSFNVTLTGTEESVGCNRDVPAWETSVSLSVTSFPSAPEVEPSEGPYGILPAPLSVGSEAKGSLFPSTHGLVLQWGRLECLQLGFKPVCCGCVLACA